MPDTHTPYASLTIFYTAKTGDTDFVVDADVFVVKQVGSKPTTQGFDGGSRFLEWRHLHPMTAADIGGSILKMTESPKLSFEVHVDTGNPEDAISEMVHLKWRAEIKITKPCDEEFWAERHLKNAALKNVEFEVLRVPGTNAVDLDLPSVG